MSAHTPTPWEFTHAGDRTYIDQVGDFDGAPIAVVNTENAPGRSHDESKENAVFIVRAANMHDELVAALTEALADAEQSLEACPPDFFPGERDMVARWRSLLARAQP